MDLAEAARRFGSRPALVPEDGASLSYEELDRRSDEVAAGLVRRGLGPGDVVCLLLPTSPAYAVTYLAAAKVGAATAGVNSRLAPVEQQALVELASPRLVLPSADEVEELRVPDGTPPPLAPDPDRPVALVFTSGTTGTPKAAVFGHRQLSAITAIDVGETWGGGGPMLVSTGMVHIGFMTKLPSYLRMGATMHLLKRWRAEDALALVSRHHMPSVGGVAAQIALMLRVPDFDAHDFSSVKTIVVGGAASPPELVLEARRRFDAAYSIRYSSTESGGVGTGTAFDAPDEEALHTVGRPRPGIGLEIRGEDGSVLAPGEVGEVCLRSPATMVGYWRDPSATAEVLVDGWLRTGDLGFVDEPGCLRLAGRRKEMFIRGGYNVFPVEVEAVLLSHPAVAAVAVVPAPDPVMGEVGVAVVVPRDPTRPPGLDELRTFAAERLAAYKLPERLRVVDELPLTPMDKVDRRALTDLVVSDGPGVR